MAGPLRSLDVLLQKISSKTFLPDATRSGRFPAEGAPEDQASSSSSSSSSSAGSDVSDNAGSDFELPEQKIIKNLATGMYHLSTDDGLKLMCGKCLPMERVAVEALPADARLCSRCF